MNTDSKFEGILHPVTNKRYLWDWVNDNYMGVGGPVDKKQIPRNEALKLVEDLHLLSEDNCAGGDIKTEAQDTDEFFAFYDEGACLLVEWEGAKGPIVYVPPSWVDIDWNLWLSNDYPKI